MTLRKTMATLSQYSKEQRLSLYNCWKNMRNRCDNTESKDAKNYALRGITYDLLWSSWDAFCNDMAETHKPGLMLERLNNDKGYSKANCSWVTRKEQNNNKRSNTFFTINGQTKTLAQWCEMSSIKASTIRQRYYVYKWPIETALSFSILERGK